MTMRVHIIGLGVNQNAHLDVSAQQALLALSPQDVVLGSSRQHDTIGAYSHQAQRFDLPKLSELKPQFDQWQQQGVKQVAVLASGDPLFFGIGAWLLKNLLSEELLFYPNVSSIQAACHRVGLSLQDVQTVSLHGRPLRSLRRYLQPNQTLALLTDKHSQPKQIAQECLEAGLSQAKIIVCESLGYDNEAVQRFDAESLANSDHHFDPLNVVVVKTHQQKSVYPSAPGIPDVSFVTDKGDGKGMITKREVRLAILSYMGIEKGDVVWDIGAGCGGVSVELSYWHPQSRVIAIEHHADRLACLQANQARFGVEQNLTIVAGRAPEALADLPTPNKVFIGGSDGELSRLMEQVWEALPQHGSLLVSAVTEDTKQQVLAFAQLRENAQDTQEDSVQIAVSKGERLAGQRVYRPSLPVTLYHFTKTELLPISKGTMS